MANIVGVLLIVLVLVGVPLKYLTEQGSGAQHAGEWITTYLGIAHGWLYMIFLVTAFWLSRKAKWDLLFTFTTLLSGTIPIVSFWAERRATRRVRTQLDAAEGTPTVQRA
jgi:integral membrane protein